MQEDVAKPNQNAQILALASYGGFFVGIPILWILPMVTRDEPFALFHAKHAGTLFLGSFVSGIVLFVVYFVVGVVTCGFGWILMAPVFLVVGVVQFCLLFFGLYDSVRGEMTEVPYLTPASETVFGSIQCIEE